MVVFFRRWLLYRIDSIQGCNESGQVQNPRTCKVYMYNCCPNTFCTCTRVENVKFLPGIRVPGYLRQNCCSQDLQNHTDSQSCPISMSEHDVPDSELLDYNMKRPRSRGVSSRIQGNIYPGSISQGLVRLSAGASVGVGAAPRAWSCLWFPASTARASARNAGTHDSRSVAAQLPDAPS
jgi:hypothetical protein